MAAVLPEGTGARLVAAYSRDDLEERYAFCRTKAGKTFFFARAKDGEPYGTPTEARESDHGYVVDFVPQGTSYHFRDGDLTSASPRGRAPGQENVPAARHMSGAGGTRTHGRRIMSPLL